MTFGAPLTRRVTDVPGIVHVFDISGNGDVLLGTESWRLEARGRAPGESSERDLSWHDFSNPLAISRDGRRFMFIESGGGGGTAGVTYVRPMDGGPAVRLAEGSPMDMSPDGAWVAVLEETARPAGPLVLVPTGPGVARRVDVGDLDVHWVRFLPGAPKLVLGASAPGRPPRMWLQDIAGPTRVPFGPEGVTYFMDRHASTHAYLRSPVSHDGRRVAAAVPEGLAVFPVSGGGPVPVPGANRGLAPVAWADDGRSLYAVRYDDALADLYRVDVATGRKNLVRRLTVDPVGFARWWNLVVTPDGEAYVYSVRRILSELYLARGLR